MPKPNIPKKPSKSGWKVASEQVSHEDEEMLTSASDHDYVKEANMAKRKDIGSAPTTPNKAPAGKKSKNKEENEEDVSNLTILIAIQNMAKDVEELKEKAAQSSSMLAALSKAVQFNAEEVKECKGKVNELEMQFHLLKKENVELKERLKEKDRYKMRWCLKFKGLPEKKDENIRQETIQLFKRIIPDIDLRRLEDAVDVVHRVGKKEDNRSRAVIVLFARRLVKEEIWRRSKDSPVCKERGIRFSEMMPLEDREARKKLWPQVEQE
ncbi:uncharacterized protein LOC112163327 [Oryzias melastigma]|uniref:uncharacterized protein LOC112163327 n=1 Tax=Oryzias melastigma TaxID=30732 RepID=UPI000CF7C3C5|nr:uncharacterized protein LOC112163327 [Oryzias melastigma]